MLLNTHMNFAYETFFILSNSLEFALIKNNVISIHNQHNKKAIDAIMMAIINFLTI